jgi:hypothetical protein
VWHVWGGLLAHLLWYLGVCERAVQPLLAVQPAEVYVVLRLCRGCVVVYCSILVAWYPPFFPHARQPGPCGQPGTATAGHRLSLSL